MNLLRGKEELSNRPELPWLSARMGFRWHAHPVSEMQSGLLSGGSGQSWVRCGLDVRSQTVA